ncbi:MAG: hypothetical protein QG597_2036 [Actinomycetota bacterium]|nr:hypothetical protein [Actinomycetota bacterium]
MVIEEQPPWAPHLRSQGPPSTDEHDALRGPITGHYRDSDHLEVDTDRVGQPAVLGVITATGNGYTRADGAVVIPVGALGP